MEIERKFLVTTPPENYGSFPLHEIEQAYLCTEPVVRIRKEDDNYYLTYKDFSRGKNIIFRSQKRPTPTCSQKRTGTSSRKNATCSLSRDARISPWNSMSLKENSPDSCSRRLSFPPRRTQKPFLRSPGLTGM